MICGVNWAQDFNLSKIWWDAKLVYSTNYSYMYWISYIMDKIVWPHKMYSIRTFYNSRHFIIIKFQNALLRVVKDLLKMKCI